MHCVRQYIQSNLAWCWILVLSRYAHYLHDMPNAYMICPVSTWYGQYLHGMPDIYMIWPTYTWYGQCIHDIAGHNHVLGTHLLVWRYWRLVIRTMSMLLVLFAYFISFVFVMLRSLFPYSKPSVMLSGRCLNGYFAWTVFPSLSCGWGAVLFWQNSSYLCRC